MHDRHIDHEHVIGHIVGAQVGDDLDHDVAPNVDEAHQGPENDHTNVQVFLLRLASDEAKLTESHYDKDCAYEHNQSLAYLQTD